MVEEEEDIKLVNGYSGEVASNGSGLLTSVWVVCTRSHCFQILLQLKEILIIMLLTALIALGLKLITFNFFLVWLLIIIICVHLHIGYSGKSKGIV